MSGRGVGMDVVRSNIRDLQGSIDIRSESGSGTAFSIKLPTSLIVSKGILLEALQRGHDWAGGDALGSHFPIAGDLLFAGTPDQRFDEGSALLGTLQRDVELLDRLVDEE